MSEKENEQEEMIADERNCEVTVIVSGWKSNREEDRMLPN